MLSYMRKIRALDKGAISMKENGMVRSAGTPSQDVDDLIFPAQMDVLVSQR